jgi:quercetin dioxygenase-like cupin family protein
MRGKQGLPLNSSTSLAKTDALEVIRMVLPRGKIVPTHTALGEITVQCLSGRVRFEVGTQQLELTPGDWLFLSASQPHALEAEEESVVLLTRELGSVRRERPGPLP